jgi:hypothetical protein
VILHRLATALDEEPTADETAAEAVARLGVDVDALARRIHARLDAEDRRRAARRHALAWAAAVAASLAFLGAGAGGAVVVARRDQRSKERDAARVEPPPPKGVARPDADAGAPRR